MTLPFVRDDLTQLTAYTPHPEATAHIPQVVDALDTNECPYDLPPELKKKLAWLYQQHIQANRYPEGSHLELKQRIAAYVNETAHAASSVTANHISVGNGSDELIRSVLIATCLGEQGSILVATPTFSMYGILAQTLGIPVHSLERTPDFAIDVSAATALLNNAPSQNRATALTPPVRVIFLVHPNSPTGNPLTPAELAWLRQLPDSILVVIDEAYFEFCQHTLVAELPQRPNWVILRTFSKAFRLAAHRVGYGIAHPELIRILEKVRLPYNLPAFSQAAATLALEHRSDLLAVIPEILAERDRLTAALQTMPELQCWPSAANFLYLRAKNNPTSPELVQTLKAQGTAVRYTGGGIRITVGSPAENNRTLNRLQQALKTAP